MGTVVRSSTQHIFIDAPPAQIWELVGDPNRHADWWPDVIEAQCAASGSPRPRGGTFVEGYFAIEPQSIGTTVFATVAGRRIMSSWLQSSLENLKRAAERSAATAG